MINSFLSQRPNREIMVTIKSMTSIRIWDTSLLTHSRFSGNDLIYFVSDSVGAQGRSFFSRRVFRRVQTRFFSNKFKSYSLLAKANTQFVVSDDLHCSNYARMISAICCRLQCSTVLNISCLFV